MVDMSVKLKDIVFKNPVMTASGTYGYGDEYESLYNPALLGAVLSKGLTNSPNEGNPPPRIFETPAGILNSIGLQNMGIDAFLEEKVPTLEKKDITVIANIAGKTIEEFGVMAAKCEKSSGIKAIEVNVSCPNVKSGGMAFGVDAENIYKITKVVKENSQKPILIKLSPNVTNIVEMAQAAKEGGADGVTLINTLLGMAIDVENMKPFMKNKVAGLSGPAIKPVAIRMVYQVKSKFPELFVVGVGGISSGRDAIEFMLAGANVVQVGTALFSDPLLPINIIDEIKKYLIRKKFSSVSDIVGRAI